MATGFLKVIVSEASGDIPISRAQVTILTDDNVLYNLATDESGTTAPVPLETPPVEWVHNPDADGQATYSVRAIADGFGPVTVKGIEISGGETTLLPVNMDAGDESNARIIDIPPPPRTTLGIPPPPMLPTPAQVLDFIPLNPTPVVEATSLDPIPYPGVVMRRGMNGPSIRQAQERLNARGANPRLATDGIFGSLTEAAVIAFQRAHNLTPDGIIGPLTWNALFGNTVIPPPTVPVHPPYPGVVLMRGMSGPSIAQVQARLNVLGANPRLATDGIFGPLTEAAVIAFQRANGLVPDGIVGVLTWNALFAGNPPIVPPIPPPPPLPPPPARVFTIVLDPGHGGVDSGAVSHGRRESADNLRLALAVQRILLDQGQRVIMTRSTDTSVTLGERSAISNRNNADIFVSLHRNAFSNPAANGVENFVFTTAPPRTVQYAQNVLDRVVAVGVQSNRGLKRGNFAVLRATQAPAMLLEMGFITNTRDNQLFDQHFDAYARAIAQGIMESLMENQ